MFGEMAGSVVKWVYSKFLEVWYMDTQVQEMMEARIASLESKVDYLESEITTVDRMLKEIGFGEGIETLKISILELIAESQGDREL